jgi:hypothetical protein
MLRELSFQLLVIAAVFVLIKPVTLLGIVRAVATKHMGTFRNETIKWLSIGLGVVVALYLLFVMIPMAQVPLYSEGVRKSGLRIGIEGRLHFLGII